jgi:hypothetical protein
MDDLLACLELVTLPDDAGSEDKNLPLEYHRLFGGQLIGQFIAAAGLTCPGKSVKSLHVLFPREGHADEPARYTVDRHHERHLRHPHYPGQAVAGRHRDRVRFHARGRGRACPAVRGPRSARSQLTATRSNSG